MRGAASPAIITRYGAVAEGLTFKPFQVVIDAATTASAGAALSVSTIWAATPRSC